eukprot:TRINITY_DN6965_c0_g1_i1.p1 TRINITY_DN6965_c0_g1~~TRINITY_DN6965_c0_g1_i1.p1  ORF type:complete len:212 (-),score=44.39 TRINITY_DN6965_c0_g1_i1:88-723(-)
MARFLSDKFILLALSFATSRGEPDFLGSRGQRVSVAAVQTGLEDLGSLQELARTMPNGIPNELRIARNFALLKDVFEAAPKHEDGKVGIEVERELLASHFSKLSSRTIQTAPIGGGSAGETSFDLRQTAVLATVLESDEWMQHCVGDVTAAGDELLNMIGTDGHGQSEQVETEHESTWVAPWSVFFIMSSAAVLLARSVGKKTVVGDAKSS